MCGINGFISFPGSLNKEQLSHIGKKMADALAHRGPDDFGIWCDEYAGVSLGHRRLSIIDLSEHGHQPMLSYDSRYVMVLNGEIYNHVELRNELLKRGYQFRGGSDTEVAVCSIQEWGIAVALTKFVGMFAFGVWDKKEKKLFLARDRLGEKPLYYGKLNDAFVFASELKALKEHPSWRGDIDRDALTQLLKYTYIPSPYSIYTGIYKLLPGTWIEISWRENYHVGAPQSYWSLGEVATQGISSRKKQQDPLAAIEHLNTLLSTTIRDQMIADVPLGAFLSGGIDSSTVVALMQSHTSRPVKTFSIGFNESEYNEAAYAKEVARHLGTDHTELYVTPGDTLSVIPKIPELYDEPFSDSSQIPTYLVSQLARRDVTVALSGDGGDELFGGYSRYMVGLDAWKKINKIPGPVRSISGKVIHAVPASYIDLIIKPVLPLLPKQFRYNQFGQKLHKLAHVWNTTAPDSIYHNLISLWPNPEEIVIGSNRWDMLARHRPVLAQLDNFTERMMFTDSVTYLPDDILVKVDRASMAVSLEVRVPFLDHRIIEFIWNQSPELKIVGTEGKWLLRQVLNKYVPKKLIDRPKMGFGVPIDLWLRGPLKEWAGDLLSVDRLKRQGLLNPEPIQAKWNAHLSGESSWHYHLWPVLMFQAWHEHWLH